MRNVHEIGRGRWKGILSALGVPHEHLQEGKPCAFCKAGDDRASFLTSPDTGVATYFCRTCGSHSAMDLLMEVKGWDFAQAAQEVRRIAGEGTSFTSREPQASFEKVNRVLDGAKPLREGCPVSRYLRRRGITVLPEQHVLFQREAWGTDGEKAQSGPAMVALIHGSDTKLKGVHKTFIDDTFPKSKRKQITKGEGVSINGGAVRLFAPRDGVIGLCEGIESALAAYELFGIPTWATISAQGMSAFRVPCGIGIREICIFADNDESYTGQAAAFALAQQLYRKKIDGEELVVHPPFIPRQPGSDWNDELLLRGQA